MKQCDAELGSARATTRTEVEVVRVVERRGVAERGFRVFR